MPNDAKLGLVLGVGLVIAVAVMYFRKDGVTADPADMAASAAGPAAAKPKTAPKKPVKAKPTGNASEEGEAAEADASPLPTPNVLQQLGGADLPELTPTVLPPAEQPPQQERNDAEKGQ